MKLYLFYKSVNDILPFLYAITENKNYYKEFISERNMDMFKVINRSIDKDEFNVFKDKNYGYFLDKRKYYTKDGNVSILSTYNEEEDSYIKSDKIYEELSKYITPIAKTFNNEILKALNDLQYFEISKFYNNEDDVFLSGVHSDYLYESSKNKPDIFGIFLMLYGNTFKIKSDT